MKNFRSIPLLLAAALAGCGEPSYEQCIRDAVKDGKTEYGIKLLHMICEDEKLTRLEIRDKQCFAELTEKFGEPAVEDYKYSLGSQYGSCDPSVDIPSWVIQAEEESRSSEATEEAANAAVEGAVGTQ